MLPAGLLAPLLFEEDVVSSVRHRTQLTSLFACPLQDSANRVEALYGNYAPKRAGIGIRSQLKLQPGDVLTACRQCARGDFGRDGAVRGQEAVFDVGEHGIGPAEGGVSGGGAIRAGDVALVGDTRLPRNATKPLPAVADDGGSGLDAGA